MPVVGYEVLFDCSCLVAQQSPIVVNVCVYVSMLVCKYYKLFCLMLNMA
jgi:hypothetical protein